MSILNFFKKKKRIIRVHLKLQSDMGEERRPFNLGESIEVRTLDGSSTNVIWVKDFYSNEELKEFVNHDRCCMMLPSSYEGVDFAMIMMDEEDWDMMALMYNV